MNANLKLNKRASKCLLFVVDGFWLMVGDFHTNNHKPKTKQLFLQQSRIE